MVAAGVAAGFDCLALVKPQFELGRERVGKGGVVRAPDDRRDALVAVGEFARGELGLLGARLRIIRAAGAGGQSRELRLDRGRGRPACGAADIAAAAALVEESREAAEQITVLTHQYPQETADAIGRLIDYASRAGVEVRVSEEEVAKHGSRSRDGSCSRAEPDGTTPTWPWCSAATGRSSRRCGMFAGRGAPVFAINYGAIGFLSTVDHGGLEEGMQPRCSRATSSSRRCPRCTATSTASAASA